MSKTPRTDAACGWPVGHHGRIESSDLKLSPDGPFVHSSIARELERENAALRADKERLDWVIKDSYYHFFFKLSSDLEKGRRQIDAAQKEAQP